MQHWNIFVLVKFQFFNLFDYNFSFALNNSNYAATKVYLVSVTQQEIRNFFSGSNSAEKTQNE